MFVSAVLLAAGFSRRFGGPKLLARGGEETLVARTARVLLEGGADEVVAVLGARREEVAEALAGLRVRCVVNSHPDAGMFSSVKVGLAGADPHAERIAVTPADLPQLDVRDVAAVLEEARRAAPEVLVVAGHGARRGHPLVFSRAAAERLLGWPESRRLNELFDEPRVAVHVVPCGPGALHDVDVPADLSEGAPGSRR